MKKVIGIVSEGPTDYVVLKAVIDRITGEENRYLPLQPEPNLIGQYGNGWKGVWRWCRETPSINLLLEGVQPKIDAIVIQMDGDVVRKEKEVHCLCESTECEKKGAEFPLYCKKAAASCPVEIPCKSHSEGTENFIKHGIETLSKELKDWDKDHVIITIPCDSTDTWVIAAYEDIADTETIIDPWKTIIARGKNYQGIRVHGDKKNVVTYSVFAEKVAENWELVVNQCQAASLLDKEIKRSLIQL